MNIVDEMMQYRKTGDLSILISSELQVDEENLKDIVIEILSWLKLEYKRSMWILQDRKTCLKPMQLNMQYAWCVELCKIVKNEKNLAIYFALVREN